MCHVEHPDHELLRAVVLQETADPERVISRFLRYHEMLLRWNRRMNLISAADESRIVARHFLESAGFLKLVPMQTGSHVLDIGTGAGFPGVPMKLIRQDLEMTLVDSRRKRILFIEALVEALALRQTNVICSRIEALAADVCADIVVSRSVADLCSLVKWSRPVLKSGGTIAVLKGSRVENEIEQLRKEADRLGVEQLEQVDFNPFPEIIHFDHRYGVLIKLNEA